MKKVMLFLVSMLVLSSCIKDPIDEMSPRFFKGKRYGYTAYYEVDGYASYKFITTQVIVVSETAAFYDYYDKVFSCSGKPFVDNINRVKDLEFEFVDGNYRINLGQTTIPLEPIGSIPTFDNEYLTACPDGTYWSSN